MVDWRPSTDWQALQARARLYAYIREWMARREVLEVETPVLSAAGNSDPAITQFSTRIGAQDQPGMWLRSSPEYPMKRLLAAGGGDIFELGRVFRRGEAGRNHNPEFTLLEWYRLGWNYRDLADETTDLVVACGALHGLDWSRERLDYGDWFARHTGLDPHRASREELSEVARRHGVHINRAQELQRDDWLDLLVSHLVQPAMPPGVVTAVLDYPASQAALARIRDGKVPVAERFEVFIGSQELANGYQELTDPLEQRRRFEDENRRREATGGQAVPLDGHLLAALESGLPDCAGVALGVDRLLMACLGSGQIAGVLAFPVDRA